MNTTSKRKTSGLLGLLAAGLLMACQGPWSYWPDNEAPFKGIWTYAHVIAGRPVTGVCFTPLLELDETTMESFAFYKGASVRLQGLFSGKDTSFALSPEEGRPNCFAGPSDLIPAAGGTYLLDASIDWDSAGTAVTSVLHAQTYIPSRFSIDHAYAPAPALQADAFANPQVQAALFAEFGDTLLTLSQDTAAALAFYAANGERISKVLRSLMTPYQEGDTVYYMAPPNDLLSHYYSSDFSADVGGVLLTQVFDTATVGYSETTFDSFFGQTADTLDKVDVGDRHRLTFFTNQDILDLGNELDSMAVNNVWYLIGQTQFLFYATTPEYADYVYSAIDNAEDSRVTPKYNVEGGAGIFAGMLVDTFTVDTKAPTGAKVFPYMRARTLYCKANGWKDKECRSHMPSFCKSDAYADEECWPFAVKDALDSGLAWNALMYTRPLLPEDQSAARYGGEKKWCIAHNFPDSVAVSTCQAEYAMAMVSDTANQSMRDLWNWCMDRGWPLDKHPQCGTALVSWARLESKQSPVLQREIEKWCESHKNDRQCELRIEN